MDVLHTWIEHEIQIPSDELYAGAKEPKDIVFEKFKPWMEGLQSRGLILGRVQLTVEDSTLDGYTSISALVDATDPTPALLQAALKPYEGPIGIKSKTQWDLIRLNDINDAIASAVAHVAPVPKEWMEERDALMWALDLEA